MIFHLLKKRIWILLFSLGFLFVAIFLYFVDVEHIFSSAPARMVENCSFLVEAEGIEKEIKIWYETTEEKFYLFVPSFMELEDMILQLPDHVKMYFDGKEMKNGANLSGYEYGKDYSFLFSNINKESTLQLVQTGGVATMYLDTKSGTMDNLLNDRDAVEKGTMIVYTEEGKLDYRGKVKKMKGRGNTSWRESMKKPLSVNLTEAGDILGIGKGKKWILINNYNEETNLSNKLIYDFAGDVGLNYSPDSELVDVYMNGVYYGIYLLSERNEIAENRVDIEKPTNKKGSSYLVDQDFLTRAKEKGRQYIRTEGKYTFSIINPKGASDSLEEEILNDFQSLENALYSEDGIDPVSGKSWDEMIDLDSWVKKYLIEEVFENTDAVKLSQFYYKTGVEGDDKIYAGPVWDYNSSWGNPHTKTDIHNPYCLRANREWIDYNTLHNWYYYLYQQDKFYNRLVEIYGEIYEPLLSDIVNVKLDQYSQKIRLSSNANLRRWKTNIEGYALTADDRIESMKTYMQQRMEFLHDDWLEGTDYCYITALISKKDIYRSYSIKYGQVLSEDAIISPESWNTKKEFLGWYDRDTNELYDFTQPVTKTHLNLYGKWK